jgi:sporulation protein YlmC with PRC-barrel domain
MAVISGKKIIGLIVKNDSRDILGKVYNFDLEIDSQNILRYYVKGDGLLKRFTTPEIIVHRNQVNSINEKEMIIDDVSIKEEIRRSEPAPSII